LSIISFLRVGINAAPQAQKVAQTVKSKLSRRTRMFPLHGILGKS